MCIFSVDANLRVGAAYLRWLVDANQGDIVAALAAYSTGEPTGYGGYSDYGDYDGHGGHGGDGDGDHGEPDGSGEPMGLNSDDRPQGYVRSIIQAWINYRGEQGRIGANQVVTATSIRSWAGWAAIGILCLLSVWAAIRYPNVDRLSEVGGQASSQQPEQREDYAGGDPCMATAGDASVSGSGDADGTGL